MAIFVSPDVRLDFTGDDNVVASINGPRALSPLVGWNGKGLVSEAGLPSRVPGTPVRCGNSGLRSSVGRTEKLKPGLEGCDLKQRQRPRAWLFGGNGVATGMVLQGGLWPKQCGRSAGLLQGWQRVGWLVGVSSYLC